MRFLLFVIARLAVAGFCLLTFAYAVLNGSPFAFDMFIKPQLFPWLTTFVAWHHVWFAAISVISALTLIPDLSGRRLRTGASNLAHWLAIAYVACAGAVSIALFASPFLPTLWNDARALPTAIASLVPLIWLAVIDHLASHADLLDIEDDARETTGPGRLFLTCAGTAIVLWSAHLLRAVVHDRGAGPNARLDGDGALGAGAVGGGVRPGLHAADPGRRPGRAQRRAATVRVQRAGRAHRCRPVRVPAARGVPDHLRSPLPRRQSSPSGPAPRSR